MLFRSHSRVIRIPCPHLRKGASPNSPDFRFFCPSVRKFSSQFLIRQRKKGTLTTKKSGDLGMRYWCFGSGRIQFYSIVIFPVKAPFGFSFMRICERNIFFGKTGMLRSFSRIEYTGDARIPYPASPSESIQNFCIFSCISESKFISVNPNCTFAGRISGKSVSSSACDVL